MRSDRATRFASEPATTVPEGADARARERARRERERLYFASQWTLIWWKFRKHKLAITALFVLGVLYLTAAFCEFIAPYTPTTRFTAYFNAPPQRVHFFSQQDGRSRFEGPFVYGLKSQTNPATFRRTFVEDTSQKYPLRFLVHGDTYKFWGLFPADLHLFSAEGGPVYLFGADSLGADIFSRIFYGARISLSIGLVGVFLSFVFGLIIGGVSGYFGGLVDEIIQRLIDFLISIPTLPFWMGLSAALPRDWPVIKTYFAITLIFSIIGWAGLARVVRGKLLALREEDFTIAAKVIGVGELRIITKHLLPLFFSYVIVSITLSVPGMILSETALSFIGLGLQPPAVSWGVLLQDAQSLTGIALYPWKLIVGLFIFVTVLMFNFLGDGLRDAADPYAR
jgi:peptide/nickel transport system permease protein